MGDKSKGEAQNGLKRSYTVIKNLDELKNNLKNVEDHPLDRDQIFVDFYHMVRLMCDNVPDMIWAKDQEKRFIFTNQAMAKKLLNAKDTQEPLGKTYSYFAIRERSINSGNPEWNDFGETCADNDENRFKTEKLARFDEFGNTKGQFFFLDVHEAPFRNEEGELLGTVGYAPDVTHEKSVEKSLLDNEQLFNILVDNMLDAVVILDFKGSILFANKAAFEILGRDPQKPLNGLNVKDFALDQSIMDIKSHQRMVKKGKYGFLGTYKIKNQAGSIIWIEGLGRKILYQGKPANLVNLRDITKRKNAEDNLKIREKLLKGVAQMNHILLNTPHLESAINDSLKEIGMAVETDRVYIFKNHEEEITGRLLTTHMYEWADDRVDSQNNNPELTDLAYDLLSPNLISNFNQKKPFYGLTRKLPPYFRKLMEKQNVLSFLLVPIFLQEKLWGFIGFDNCSQERSWKDYELTILKTAADSIASAWERFQSEKALRDSENKSKSLIRAIPDIMLIINQEGTILDYSSKNMELMPLKEGEIIGNNISKMGLSPKDLENILKHIKITIMTDTLQSLKYELDVPSGHRYFESRFIRLNDNSVLSIIRDITDQKIIENSLKSSLEEKNILLREIHHRVKNNMQIISSLLNLQMKFKNSKEKIEVLKESQGRIKTMAMVHENLYQSKSFSTINFQEYLQRLLADIFYSFGNKPHLKWDLDIEDIEIDIDITIPLGLIINEIVTNSLKYAFENRNEGNISIRLILEADIYRLRVADDGVGIPEEIDFGKTDTLGLQLIENLVKQIDGEIKMDRNHGTVYEISFPQLNSSKRF